MLKLEVTSTYNRLDVATLGEVVFREENAVTAVAEPVSMALVVP